MVNIYAARRARGLCGECGKVASETARCPRCAGLLHARCSGGGGAYGDPPATLESIGACLNLSKERARQIQDEAIDKMVRRMGVTRDEVLRGLAILGCAAGEVTDQSAPAFDKWAHLDDGTVH